MVILRPTRKLQSLLPTAAASIQSDTALGDWYVNRIVVGRQPLLLAVSSTSLLSMLLPARDVRSLSHRLGALVESRLRRCGIEAQAILGEKQAMHPVTVAPTIDRSVLGIMVDFATSPTPFRTTFGVGGALPRSLRSLKIAWPRRPATPLYPAIA